MAETVIKAIFDHDCDRLKDLLSIKEIERNINMKDALGNTPLMLACRLAYTNLEYTEIINVLLVHGADPLVKNSEGWSCMDEALSQADVMVIAMLFDGLVERKQRLIKEQRDLLNEMLKKTPDFYMEMKWDFDSSIIPLLSKIAPSDTFKIWKYKNCLRLDNNLVSFKKLKAKRRNMSLIYNEDIKMPTNYEASAPLFSLYRDKNQYTNIIQNFDDDEKKAMIFDLLKVEALQGNLRVKDSTLVENKGMFSNSNSHKINGWDTKKFDFKLNLEYAIFKKERKFLKETYESYVSKLELANKPGTKVLFKKPSEVLDNIKAKNGSRVNDPEVPMNVDIIDVTKVTEKKTTASLYVANNFPLKLSNLVPALRFLSNGNQLLEKLDDILKKPEIQNSLGVDAFPIKIQIPVTYTVRANVTILKYEPLKNCNYKETFTIPSNFAYVDRKEAQKTMTRVKKRMLLLNTLT